MPYLRGFRQQISTGNTLRNSESRAKIEKLENLSIEEIMTQWDIP